MVSIIRLSPSLIPFWCWRRTRVGLDVYFQQEGTDMSHLSRHLYRTTMFILVKQKTIHLVEVSTKKRLTFNPVLKVENSTPYTFDPKG